MGSPITGRDNTMLYSTATFIIISYVSRNKHWTSSGLILVPIKQNARLGHTYIQF